MAFVWNYVEGQSQGIPGPVAIEILFGVLDHSPSFATTTGFNLQDGPARMVFQGTFEVTPLFPPSVTGGTISGFQVYDGATLLLETSGYAIDYQHFRAVLDLIQTDPSNGGPALLDMLVGGPMIINGSNDADLLLFGGKFADSVFGRDGDDRMNLGDGNDFASGGEGKDSLRGDNGSDTADYSEKLDTVAVTLQGAAEAQVFIGGVLEDTLEGFENINGGKGIDKLVGDGLINRLNGSIGDDVLSGRGGNDLLKGDAGLDCLIGGVGNDRLRGGAGNDVLKGGANSDGFIFDTRLGASNIDRIGDFSHVADSIWLDHDTFKALDVGTLKAKFFHVGEAAETDDQLVIYNQETGGLFYDRDGLGGAAQVRFATLFDTGAHHPANVAANDFIII